MKTEKKTIKSIIGENNKLTRAISIIFLVFIMFGLFAFILIGLYKIDLINIPQFIQNIFFKPDDGGEEIQRDDSPVYDFLRDNNKDNAYNPDETGYIPEITLENIKVIISKIKLPDNLYLETDANYYTDGKITRTEEMFLWKKGEKYKYELSINSNSEESYINDSKNEQTENFSTGNKLKKAVVPIFSFDNIPHIQNINHYLDLLDDGEIIRFYLDRESDSNMVLIRYESVSLDQREEIHISLDTGIVTQVRCWVGENNDLYYECSTTVIEAYYDGDEQSAEKTVIQDSMFVIK